MRKSLLCGLAIAALSVSTAGTASAQPRFDTGLSNTVKTESALTQVQYRRYGGYRGYRGGYRGRRYNGGAAVGAGIAGLAAGAIIAGAIANQNREPVYGDGYYEGGAAPVMGDEVSYCMQRFRSYDPNSGTYLGYDGIRHACP